MINQIRIKAGVLALTVLTMVSCNKEETQRMAVGNLTEGDYNLHNNIILGVDNGAANYESVQIDVDHDGVNDFEFRSYEDSLFYPEPIARHRANVFIINSAFRIAYIPGSGTRSLGLCSTSYDYYGTYPRVTDYCAIECSDIGSEDYSIPNHTKYYEKDKFVYSIESWSTQEELTIAFYGGSHGEANFNDANDTILSTIINLPEGCDNPSGIDNIYICFRKDEGENASIGWIELNVFYTGKLIVVRSAIKAIKS